MKWVTNIACQLELSGNRLLVGVPLSDLWMPVLEGKP